MDTITHAISGAVIGAATAARDGENLRHRALWGALFAAFPDSDAAIALFADHFTYLNAHRGLTHSLILLPLWAALLGWLGAAAGRARWREMALLAAAALAAHILGDLITSYGTRVFTPVYDAPLAYPITFIIDPLFTLILLAGLVPALWRRSRVPATAAGIALACYLAMQATLQYQATVIGREYAASIGHGDAPVIAFPQPLSPFNWKIVVVAGATYHHAYANLLLEKPRPQATDDDSLIRRIRAAYRPVEALDWKRYPRWPKDRELRELAMAAWADDSFAGFREFALLPHVTSIRGDERRVCVWFTDLRFTLQGMRPPFEYAMCRNRQGEWQLELEADKPDRGEQ